MLRTFWRGVERCEGEVVDLDLPIIWLDPSLIRALLDNQYVVASFLDQKLKYRCV